MIVEIGCFEVNSIERVLERSSEVGEGLFNFLSEKHSLLALEDSDFHQDPLCVVTVVSVVVRVELISIQVYQEP